MYDRLLTDQTGKVIDPITGLSRKEMKQIGAIYGTVIIFTVIASLLYHL